MTGVRDGVEVGVSVGVVVGVSVGVWALTITFMLTETSIRNKTHEGPFLIKWDFMIYSPSEIS